MFGLGRDSRAELLSYVRLMLGFPANYQDNLGRMMYVSAVTITTLGYGDIVPLSGRARAGTACEAVVGVLLAGLFFNSLAAQLRLRVE